MSKVSVVSVGDQVIVRRKTRSGVKETREFEVTSAWPGSASEAAFVSDGDNKKHYLTDWEVEVIPAEDPPEWKVTIAFQIEGDIYSTGRTEEEARRRLLEQFGGSLPPVWEMDKETLIASEITQIEKV